MPEPPVAVRFLDHAPEVCPSLAVAMALVVARYPEAVFSDVEWTTPTIVAWPTNAASQDADVTRAEAQLTRGAHSC